MITKNLKSAKFIKKICKIKFVQFANIFYVLNVLLNMKSHTKEQIKNIEDLIYEKGTKKLEKYIKLISDYQLSISEHSNLEQ